MKIGSDSKRLYSNLSGLGNYSRTMLKNLQVQYPEHEYFLYTTKVKSSPETNHFLESPFYNTHVSKAAIKPLWRSYGIMNQFKRDAIELYHGLSHELPLNIHKYGVKSVVTIHDLIFKSFPKLYPFIDRKFYDFKFSNSCRVADKIIAISEHTKNDIVKYYNIDPDKIEVIYQSCHPVYYTSAGSSKSEEVIKKYNLPADYLLFVGSIEKRKNLDAIILAYRHLSADFKTPLVVVGRGKKHKQHIHKLIQSEGLDQLVIFLDTIDDDSHLKMIYENARALLYPSIYEGFGLPVIEALISKTPVITSNTSSMPEAGGPDSLYINPECPEEIAYAIERVLSDTELVERMKNNGLRYATENFSPEVATRSVMDLYNQTLIT